ncbi:hypothetical protein ACFQ2U_13005 [Undibacterium aquatile]
MQISRNKLFAYCEGKNIDPFFYGQLLNKACKNESIEYVVNRANQIDSKTGGKEALKKLFYALKRKKSLKSKFKGKEFNILFFMDKDADCVLKKRIRSDHVIYTELYSVENYIYKYGKLRRAIAISACLDEPIVSTHFSCSKTWVEQKALLWKEWITLCLFSQIYSVNSGCTYGRISIINDSDTCKLLCNTNRNLYNEQVTRIKNEFLRKTNLQPFEFELKFKRVEMLVEKKIKEKILFSLFKGKWCANILESEVKDLHSQEINLDNLGKRIESTLLATLDFSDDWALYFFRKIEKIIH